MSNETLIDYLRQLGWNIEVIQGNDRLNYLVIKNFSIPLGTLTGKMCDIAIQQNNAVPFVLASAIHTRPHLVPMDMNSKLRTQKSPIGLEWQYWSRVLNKPLTPQNIVTHIATIFSEV